MNFILISFLLVGLASAAPTTNFPDSPTQNPGGGGGNTWTEGEYTLTINDESNGQVPSSTIQNQKDIFFAIYPDLASQYSDAPTSVTINIDPSTPINGAGAGTGSFSLSAQRLAQISDDGGYVQYGINYMLSSYYTPNGQITTPANPSGDFSVLTDDDRQTALDEHNKYRSMIALGNAVNQDGSTIPQASNMWKMTWSRDVETDAQAWANKCDFSHSTPDGSNEGQNIFLSAYVENSRDALIDAAGSWYSELAEFGIDSNALSSYHDIGHFTQVGWWNSNELGCGIANCSHIANSPGTGYVSYVVCNYRAAGNVGSDPMYTPGSPASDCTAMSEQSVADFDSGLCDDQSLDNIH